jgi:hypothetical protein
MNRCVRPDGGTAVIAMPVDAFGGSRFDREASVHDSAICVRRYLQIMSDMNSTRSSVFSEIHCLCSRIDIGYMQRSYSVPFTNAYQGARRSAAVPLPPGNVHLLDQ